MMTTSLEQMWEASTGVARDLIEAALRIKRKKPRDASLKSAARDQTLRITYSTVAKEAGHSRSLIGHKHCPYPEIRAAIADEIRNQRRNRDVAAEDDQQSHNNPTSEEIINNLRHENRTLKSEKQALATKLMTALIEVRDMEKRLERERAKRERSSRTAGGQVAPDGRLGEADEAY